MACFNGTFPNKYLDVEYAGFVLPWQFWLRRCRIEIIVRGGFATVEKYHRQGANEKYHEGARRKGVPHCLRMPVRYYWRSSLAASVGLCRSYLRNKVVPDRTVLLPTWYSWSILPKCTTLSSEHSCKNISVISHFLDGMPACLRLDDCDS